MRQKTQPDCVLGVVKGIRFGWSAKHVTGRRRFSGLDHTRKTTFVKKVIEPVIGGLAFIGMHRRYQVRDGTKEKMARICQYFFGGNGHSKRFVQDLIIELRVS